ncbi:unnamed protein product [Lymnaea stagnalis]|uniref:Uncharacterized protein n=1 Tax=Lymnaea stagnalis TaxID=6523 RepID=A0AAV2HYL9_LYMST
MGSVLLVCYSLVTLLVCSSWTQNTTSPAYPPDGQDTDFSETLDPARRATTSVPSANSAPYSTPAANVPSITPTHSTTQNSVFTNPTQHDAMTNPTHPSATTNPTNYILSNATPYRVTAASSTPRASTKNTDSRDSLAQNTGSADGRSSASSVQEDPVWLRCLGQVTRLGSSNESSVVSVLTNWCQNNETVVDCLSRDFAGAALDNPLDFFINLTFSEDQLRDKSVAVCSAFLDRKDQLGCAVPVNDSRVTQCLATLSSGLVHVFGLHREKNLPTELLREVACDVTLQTTLCLRDTLSGCDDEVQTTLINYYSLFSNESCIAKRGQDNNGLNQPETVVAKCAKEAAHSVLTTQPDPVTLLDFLILGIRTDCQTFPTRYACYHRELDNITNFRDFWLSLTFDYDNAMASQKAYCGKIESQVISKVTEECFNQSHPKLARCEIAFGRELEAIREEWFNNSDLDGLELQKLACRTTLSRAACLDNAMQPCGLDVARVMAVSEMAILPDICRRLLVPEQQPPPNGTGDPSDDLNAAVSGTGDPSGDVNAAPAGTGDPSEDPNAALSGTGTGDNQDVEEGQLRNNELPHSVSKGDPSSSREGKEQPPVGDNSRLNNSLYAPSDDASLNNGGHAPHPNMIQNEPMKHQTNETVSSNHHENNSGYVQLNVCLITTGVWLALHF